MFNLIAKTTYKLTNFLGKHISLEKILKSLVLARLIFMPAYQKKHKLPGKLVVSLTSFPPRFSTLKLTIRTLLSQSARPNIIILWIYEKDFEKLPKNVLDLQNDLFYIEKTNQDTRSYKKIIPTLINHPDAFIVTADDDIYYNYDWLEELIDNYNPKRKEIIGHRGHQITFNDDKSTKPYIEWRWCIGKLTTGGDVFLTGGAGTLYPPKSLASEVVDTAVFMQKCSTADDVWLHFMARLNGYTSKKIPSNFREFAWSGSQEFNLNLGNVDQGANDVCIKNLEEIYGKLKDINQA